MSEESGGASLAKGTNPDEALPSRCPLYLRGNTRASELKKAVSVCLIRKFKKVLLPNSRGDGRKTSASLLPAKRKLTPILGRHLLDKVPVSDLCGELGFEPTAFCVGLLLQHFTKKASSSFLRSLHLDVVIELELVRMGTQTHGVHFLLALVVDVGVQHLLGEDVALEQKLIVASQRIQRVFQRTGHRRDLRQFLRTEIVDVLVERLARI